MLTQVRPLDGIDMRIQHRVIAADGVPQATVMEPDVFVLQATAVVRTRCRLKTCLRYLPAVSSVSLSEGVLQILY